MGVFLRRRCVVVVASALLAALPVVPAEAIDHGEGWLVPVDAEIVDPFRPPPTRFSAGNRGIEYATVSGDAVRAVDDGRVAFAGRVGTALYVTLDHGNGLRSTYAFLESIGVVRGQDVARGGRLATAGPGFHLTARLGDDYVDPALLFAGATVVVALVDLVLVDPVLVDERSPGAGPSRSPEPPWFEPWIVAFWSVGDLAPTRRAEAFVDAVGRWSPGPCTDSSVVVGPVGAGRTLIQVAGLGSDSGNGSIGRLDPLALGYHETDVIGFSYAGGATPTPFGLDAVPGALGDVLGANAYGPVDTLADLDLAAGRLADLIEAAAVANPGRPIDVAAHSLGGVVARRALEILVERPGAVLPDTIVTIGSPHAGADLATAAVGLGPIRMPSRWSDREVARYLEAESVRQVAELGLGALDRPSSPPPGVRVVTIGGAVDLVVPMMATTWEGADHVLVPGVVSEAPTMHAALPGREDVRREVGLAVSGRPPGCRSASTVLTAIARSQAIIAALDVATVLAGVSGGLAGLLPDD